MFVNKGLSVLKYSWRGSDVIKIEVERRREKKNQSQHYFNFPYIQTKLIGIENTLD